MGQVSTVVGKRALGRAGALLALGVTSALFPIDDGRTCVYPFSHAEQGDTNPHSQR